MLCIILCLLNFTIDSYLQFRSNGGVGAFQIEFSHYLTQRFGAVIGQDDFEEMLRQHDEIIAEIMQSMRLGAGDSGNATMFHEDGNHSIPSNQRLAEAVFDGIVCGYLDRHDLIDRFIESNIRGNAPLREMRIRRLLRIRENDASKSLLNPSTFYHTLEYAQSLSILVILATLILVSRLVTTDRANRINWLQYTSKQGRGILKKQLIAVILSAVGMTTLLVFIFAGIYSVTGLYAFWNNGINSFMGFPYHWLSVTFGQYCLIITGVMYLLSVGAAVFAFILSRFSRNIILLMFKVIPFFISAVLLSNWLLREFLSLFTEINIFTQLSVFAFTLIAGTAAALAVICREKRFELT